MVSRENPEDIHLPQKSLKIEHDDKFFSRLLSKESSMKNPSFDYGSRISGAVPFLWESQPGTPNPKYTFSEETLLPLTPPPPFYTIYNYSKYKPTKKNSRSKLLHTLFSKIKLKKTELNSSLSSTSLSSSSPVVPSVQFSYSCKLEDEYEQVIDVASPTSTLCYGFGKIGGKQGCYRFS